MRFLWPVIGLCACWWTIVQCAGESDASTISSVPQWRLSQRPVVDIGVATGDPVYELTDAVSSLRLHDGGIVVADVGAGELRYFDATGRYRMTSDAPSVAGRPLSSRRGRLRPASFNGSSAVTFEGAGQRLTFDATGRLVRNELGADRVARIHGRTLFLGGTSETQARAIEALERMPTVDSATGYRIIRLDEAGYLWVEGRPEENVRRPWTIYDNSARLVGRAATLASFEPHEIGNDFILGRWRDGNGIEHIRMYGLDRDVRNVPRRDTAVTTSSRTVSPARRAAAVLAIRRSLQELALLQEGYWSKTMTYASDVALLELPARDGVEIAIIGVGVGGWKAVAYVYAADAMCGIAIGREAVPGWEEGRAVCY